MSGSQLKVLVIKMSMIRKRNGLKCLLMDYTALREVMLTMSFSSILVQMSSKCLQFTRMRHWKEITNHSAKYSLNKKDSKIYYAKKVWASKKSMTCLTKLKSPQISLIKLSSSQSQSSNSKCEVVTRRRLRKFFWGLTSLRLLMLSTSARLPSSHSTRSTGPRSLIKSLKRCETS